MSVKRWFKLVRRWWTTQNSCQTTLYTQFPQSNSGSSWFEGVEHQFGVVRAVSDGLNHPKLMSNYPVHPVPSVKQRFKLVWRGWTTLNSCQTTLFLLPFYCWSYSNSTSNSTPILLLTSLVLMIVLLWSLFPQWWFEEVRLGWTTPSSCQYLPQAWIHVLYYGSNGFRRVDSRFWATTNL